MENIARIVMFQCLISFCSLIISGVSSMTSSPPSLTGAGGNNLQSPNNVVLNNHFHQNQNGSGVTTSQTSSIATYPMNSQPISSVSAMTSMANGSMEHGNGSGLVTTVPGGKSGLGLNVNVGSFDPITRSEPRSNPVPGKKSEPTKESRSSERHDKKEHRKNNNEHGGTIFNGFSRKEEESSTKMNHSFISDLLSSWSCLINILWPQFTDTNERHEFQREFRTLEPKWYQYQPK